MTWEARSGFQDAACSADANPTLGVHLLPVKMDNTMLQVYSAFCAWLARLVACTTIENKRHSSPIRSKPLCLSFLSIPILLHLP
jgi:hypothetical protein